MINRRKTNVVWVGNVPIGGNNPIIVQSMTNTDTRDFKKTIIQIKKLEKIGCEIIRVAVVDIEAANAIKKTKKEISIPIIADIHFDYMLAIESIKSGVDGLRINPGNIGSKEKISKIVNYCKDKNIPIRIGINSGSLEKDILNRYKGITAEGMVESALKNIDILEKLHYTNIKVSLKSTEVPMMVKAYEILANKNSYPFHLGVTESGLLKSGLVKSSIGIGILVNKGIGDTIRVSLTDNPKEEVIAGYEILKTLKKRKKSINLISCPTCGRTETNLIPIVKKIKKIIDKENKVSLSIAVMGCSGNGPGEAKNADLGISAGKKNFLIFSKGKVIKIVQKEKIIEEFKLIFFKFIKKYKEKENYNENI